MFFQDKKGPPSENAFLLTLYQKCLLLLLMVIAFIMLSNVCKVNVYSFSFTKISYGLGTSRLTMIYFIHVHFVSDIYLLYR